ncbi:MAG: hypothetical protein OTI36_16620, partial [Beijerinckiaceae bacterium]|nr:hypothetical protein [Beijerinckiaceae bacterium]
MATFREVAPFRYEHVERGRFLLQVAVDNGADRHQSRDVAQAARRQATIRDVFRQKAARALRFEGFDVWTDKTMRDGARLSDAEACVSACKTDPLIGVIGVQN